MPRRIQPTLMDYVVIAINPALIIVLINSLVYFLLEMFYQGQYPERLHFCLSMFILGAVLIARISMEEGWEHAAPFGVALAVVISLAMHKFVSYKGTSLDAVGWLVNYAMIALAWWCAHRLTWDCTLVDETQDASGEGLLQTVGLDKQDANDEAAKEKDEPLKEPAAKRGNRSAEIVPTTGAILPAARVEKDGKSWWERFLERRRRPHAPGVWIIYFSLAALPIFGFGQAFIPAANVGSRRYAFVLLCVYVASALGLLLTTSFLRLRRYLRQRRLEMPATMAAAWLTTGAILVVCLLFLTALLPRTNAEYSISALPFSAGSEEHDSSRLAVGKEGTKDEQATAAKGTRQMPDEDLKSGGVQKVSHPERGEGDAAKDNRSAAGAKAKGKDSQDKDSQGQQSKQNSSGSDPSNDQARGESGGKNSSKDAGSAQQGSERSESKQSGSQSKDSESRGQAQQPPMEKSGEEKHSSSSQETSQTPTPDNPETPSPPDASGLLDGLIVLLKWVFYGAIVAVVLWWSWRHRTELIAWLKNLLQGWSSLFARRKRSSATTAKIPPSAKSFLDYSDPFASGMEAQMTVQELVRYSFEALEAWARDNGCPRGEDETPHEFARQIGNRAEHLAKPARALAEMYSIVAYSSGQLTPSAEQHLRTFWEALAGSWAAA